MDKRSHLLSVDIALGGEFCRIDNLVYLPKINSGRLQGDLVPQALDATNCSAARTKKSYFSGQYQRLAARRGGRRADLAVAHSILVTIYHLLDRGTEYQDLGVNYFDERHPVVLQAVGIGLRSRTSWHRPPHG